MFENYLDIRLIDDLANDGQGSWMLLSPLTYDRKGVKYVVPVGYITDINSTPRVIYAYRKYGNRAHRACVLHDYLITSGIVTREEADIIFLEAMASIGIKDKIAGPMFRAVSAETRNVENRKQPWKDSDA